MTRGRAEMIRNLMDCSSIELKVISCRDLKAFNFFQKLSVYTIVSIFNDEMKKDEQQNHLQLQKTPVDRDGNGNPEWNHTVHFDIKPVSLNVDNYDHWFIKFDMRSEGIVFAKKSLGKVRVPFKDLIDEFNEAVRYMSYQVRTTDGKPNGVLNFSYKVIGKNNNNNNNISGSIHESQGTESPSGIHYPTLELEQNQSQGICYPSLADIKVSSDLLPRIPVPSPNLCHWRPESDYNMSLPTPPPLPFSLPAAPPAGVYHHHHNHPCQPPGPYWYPSELTNRGYSFCRNPSGVGKLRIVDHSDSWRSTSTEDGSDILQAPDSGTTNGSCN